jgi:DNA processing protein
MNPYLFSALTRLAGVPTAMKAGLFGDLELLAALREGRPTRGLHPRLSKAFAKLDWQRCEREDRTLEASGVRIVPWDDPTYPVCLKAMTDPPPALYLRGSLEALGPPALGVVGSRLSTVYGQNVARDLAEEAVRSGMAVVSGLARGIDSAAHRGSLAVKGLAIGVLGTGIDVAYPKENAGLMARIADSGGAILTEFPPGAAPLPKNFPMRNRVIAGLAWAVVVVEAAERSGSLVTVRFALETGKEVFAVPHNITSRTGVGPNTLIQKGAKLVQRIEDILEELPEHLRCTLKPADSAGQSQNVGGSPSYSGFGDNAAKVLGALKADEAQGIDTLSAATGLAAPGLLAALLELQLGGACVELPGMRYALSRPRKESD